MANDTRSSRSFRDDETRNSKGRHSGSKVLATSGSPMMDTTGLRRSARETSSKKPMLASPSSLRKSERIEKQMPTTPPAKRKNETVEKQTTPSPLRRSERSNRHQFLSNSGSKKSDKGSVSSDMKRKREMRENSVKQLPQEAREVSHNEKGDTHSFYTRRKRLDARAYRSLFNQRRKEGFMTDASEELNGPDKLSQGESISSGGRGSKLAENGSVKCSEKNIYEELKGPVKMSQGDCISKAASGSELVENGSDEWHKRSGENMREDCLGKACEKSPQGLDSSLRKSIKGVPENHCEAGVSSSCVGAGNECEHGDDFPASNDGDKPLLSPEKLVAKEASDDSKRAWTDSSVAEKHTVVMLESTSEGRPLDDGTGLGGNPCAVHSERKWNCDNKSCDADATVASKDTCMSIAVGPSSIPSGCKSDDSVGKCVTYSKRQRLHCDSAEQDLYCNSKLDRQLSNSSFPMDSGGPEVSATNGFAEKCDSNIQQRQPHSEVQIDGNHNACVNCKLGGKLLCCNGKGCKRCYHLFCLEPPLKDVPPGIWYCIQCVQKRIESGVHSVSEGVESIWDAREVKVSDVEGLRKEKQYLIKYKGLAHVHNDWVPEARLLLEAPLLVAKFNRNNQITKWKHEWTVPHRLLQKRLLTVPKLICGNEGRHAGDNPDYLYEWLVKWCGLDYAHVSWELGSASFLNTPEVQKLMKEYENRCEKAKDASDPSIADKERLGPLVKLSKLPIGVSSGNDNNYLDSINSLRSFWHKGHNCVVINDQERVMRMILFILSLCSNVCRPFLVISMPTTLTLWEAEFLHLAPSINVIVYSGNKDVRTIIRTLEFYGDGDRILFQVLLSSPEAIVEDLEVLKCVEWEATIFDDCQSSRSSTHFEKLKPLITNTRLLLINSQIKDSVSEYLNMLSFLDPDGYVKISHALKTDSSENISTLKEKLSKFIAYECKSDSSRFIEYWVPVQLSNLQLEQYCATLLSNSIALGSCSKNDLVGALRDILVTARKCCDHPYIVDPSMQTKLTNGFKEIEVLEFGIKASAKLQLLDTILPVIKNRGLRVLILFQSVGGSVRDIIGDILDDFLRLRFGPDSYERIDGVGLITSRRLAVLSKFNNKEGGRFVFLLETRACLPSIKLSSVDIVIIFGGDWNPVNDLKALQKITIEQEMEPIKVFRFYSSCTVEERVLILAKQHSTTDCNLLNMNRSTSHMLLMWGALHLLNKLDKFHESHNPSSVADISSEQSFLKDVVNEFLSLLPLKGANTDTGNLSIILKVQQNGGTYHSNISLPGELETQLMDEKQPHMIWAKLLEGRFPQWKFSLGPPQRNRKRVQYNELPKQQDFGSHDVARTRRKVNKGKVVGGEKEAASLNEAVHANCASTSPCSAIDMSEVAEANMVESKERTNLRDAQKSLHLLLKPELSKLCEVLQLSEDIKGMVARFLEYIMNNHHVNREPVSILQAFQISLCWAAGSLLKHKIDRKESLALAKRYLNFICKEEEADFIYSKLRSLKKLFLSDPEHFKESNRLKDSRLRSKDIAEDLLHAGVSPSTLETDQRMSTKGCSDNMTSSLPTWASDFNLAEEAILRSTAQIQQKYNKQMEKLLNKQQEEVMKFTRTFEEKKAQMENRYRVELGLIRSIYSHIPVRTDKLKILDNNFSREMEEYEDRMASERKDLEAMQLVARTELTLKKARQLEELKSYVGNVSLGKLPVGESVHKVECSTMEQGCCPDHPESVASVCGHRLGEHCPNEIEHGKSRSGVAPSENFLCTPTATLASSSFSEMPTLASRSGVEINNNCGKPSALALGEASGARVKHCTTLGISNSSDNNGSINLLSPEEQILDGAPSNVAVGDPLEASEAASDEMPGSSRPVEGVALVNESERENDEMMAVASDRSIGIETSKQDAASSLIDGDKLSLEQSMVNSPAAEQASSLIEGCPLPSNQVLQNECSSWSSCLGAQNEDETASERQNASIQIQDQPLDSVDAGSAVPSDHCDHEAVVGDHMLQQQSELLSDLPLSRNQPDLVVNRSENEAQENGHSQKTTSIEVLGNATSIGEHNAPSVHFNLEALMESSAVQLPVSPSADFPSSHNEQHLPPANINERQPSCEGLPWSQSVPATSQLVGNHVLPSNQAISQSLANSLLHLPIGTEDQLNVAPTQLVENQFELSNQAVTQPTAQLALHDTLFGGLPEYITHPVQNAHSMAVQMPMPLCTDPLQNELDRLRKEMDQAAKIHEDTILQLKSDCDKEMEEMISQIRRKYDAKLQDVEATFLTKKKELDINHNKVLMNKILAEAFRSKCMDLRATGVQRLHQAVSPILMQQLLHHSSPQPTSRPLFVAGPSSVGLSAVSLQSTTTPVQIHNSSGVPSSIPGRLQSTTTPVQIHNSSGVPSSIPGRPSQISHITPPPGNFQVGTEIRAPAPHLQSFRLPTSLPTTGLLPFAHGIPTSNNSPSTSHSLSQLPPRLPLLPTPPLSTYLSTCNRALQSESSGELPMPCNFSVSAPDLPMDIDNRLVANLPNSMPFLPELGSNFEFWDLSEFGLQGSTQVNPARTDVEADVVCLSDDD